MGRVTVDPDYHYRGVYQELLQTYSDSTALRRMREALRRADAAVYVLRELRRPLP